MEAGVKPIPQLPREFVLSQGLFHKRLGTMEHLAATAEVDKKIVELLGTGTPGDEADDLAIDVWRLRRRPAAAKSKKGGKVIAQETREALEEFWRSKVRRRETLSSVAFSWSVSLAVVANQLSACGSRPNQGVVGSSRVATLLDLATQSPFFCSPFRLEERCAPGTLLPRSAVARQNLCPPFLLQHTCVVAACSQFRRRHRVIL